MPCPHSGIHTAMEMKQIQTHRSAKMICAKRSPSTKKKKKSKLQKNAYRSSSVNIYLWMEGLICVRQSSKARCVDTQ